MEFSSEDGGVSRCLRTHAEGVALKLEHRVHRLSGRLDIGSVGMVDIFSGSKGTYKQCISTVDVCMVCQISTTCS